MAPTARAAVAPTARAAVAPKWALALALTWALALAMATPAAAQVAAPRAPGLGGSLGIESGTTPRPRDAEKSKPVPQIPIAAPSSDELSKIEVRSEFSTARASIVLAWPAPAKVEWTIDGREVVLRFETEVNAPDLRDLQERSGDWLESVNYGYDSVLLRSAHDAAIAVEATDREVRVTMTLDQKPPVPDAKSAKAQARRLKLIEIDLLSRTGQLFEAREEARALIADDPTQLPAILLLAEIEQRLDNWRHALELYDEALVRSPDNPDIVRGVAQIKRERGAELRTDMSRQPVSGADTQWSFRKRGRAHPHLRTEMGFDYELRDIATPSARRLDGTDGPYMGKRQRIEAYVAERLDDPAMTLRGAVFGSHDTFGGGAKLEMSRDNRRTSTSFEWHRPYWEFVEAMIEGGHRDRVDFVHARPFDEEGRWTGGLTLAMNRYGVRDADDMAAAFAPIVELSWLWSAARPGASFSYNLDGEYRIARANRVGPGNAPYSPIPLPSRDVHTFLLSFFGDLTDYLRASAYGGYARDRLNILSKGPRFGGELVYEAVSDLELGINYLYSKASGRGSGSIVNRYGLHMTGRF